MKLSLLGDAYIDKLYKVDINLDRFVFNLEFPLSTSGLPAKGKIDFGEEVLAVILEYLDKYNIKYFGVGNEENNYNNPCIIDFSGKKIALFGYSCSITHPIFGEKV